MSAANIYQQRSSVIPHTGHKITSGAKKLDKERLWTWGFFDGSLWPFVLHIHPTQNMGDCRYVSERIWQIHLTVSIWWCPSLPTIKVISCRALLTVRWGVRDTGQGLQQFLVVTYSYACKCNDPSLCVCVHRGHTGTRTTPLFDMPANTIRTTMQSHWKFQAEVLPHVVWHCMALFFDRIQLYYSWQLGHCIHRIEENEGEILQAFPNAGSGTFCCCCNVYKL